MGFPRKEYWSVLPCPPPGDLPNPRIKHLSPASPALQAYSLPTSPLGIPMCVPSVQFSSVAQLCLTLCDPMNRSTPGLPVHQQFRSLFKLMPKLSRCCHPAISSSVVPFSSCPQSLPASGSFPMSQLFT